jgi:3-oxo-4,17-pregnadiene-20-carboxyl-CoA hydratase beta subunit
MMMSDYKTLTCAEVSIGDKLPSLDIDITTGLVVAGALATRDFESVHHNKAAAVATGLPDVFMNILTSQGLMTRFATDWSGPEAVVKSLDLRLGAPNIPGMVMTMTGEVTAVDTETGVVDIAVVGENNIWGMHMQGSVQLALPKGA